MLYEILIKVIIQVWLSNLINKNVWCRRTPDRNDVLHKY